MSDELKPATVITGDSLGVLPTFEECLFDACVCDPPYELGFMGKAWDRSGIAYSVDLWREVFRVMKPGAHLLAFGGTRTYHRMACAIEDAGFEIRDQIQWIYGSGFPKSLDVSKAIDKAAGAEREVVGRRTDRAATPKIDIRGGKLVGGDRPQIDLSAITAPATDAAKQWDGWGTALKPAHEPICLARKPLEKGLTVAQNVLKWGTGALNIDGCRVEFASDGDRETAHNNALGPVERFKTTKPIYDGGKQSGGFADTHSPKGRFPANVIHDGSDEVLAGFPENAGAFAPVKRGHSGESNGIYSDFAQKGDDGATFRNDTGSAARFFYSPKASKYDREAGLPEAGLPEAGRLTLGNYPDDLGKSGSPRARNHHPTVKPTDLMQYLCRLVTPPGGLILDPFLGSGSTAKAALIERFRIVGIELNPEYAAIAEARCTQLQVKLF